VSESNKDFRSLFELCANLAPLQWHRMIWNTVGRGPSIQDVGNLEGGGVKIPVNCLLFTLDYRIAVEYVYL
jgi:hypothetical protein